MGRGGSGSIISGAVNRLSPSGRRHARMRKALEAQEPEARRRQIAKEKQEWPAKQRQVMNRLRTEYPKATPGRQREIALRYREFAIWAFPNGGYSLDIEKDIEFYRRIIEEPILK